MKFFLTKYVHRDAQHAVLVHLPFGHSGTQGIADAGRAVVQHRGTHVLGADHPWVLINESMMNRRMTRSNLWEQIRIRENQIQKKIILHIINRIS